MKMIIRNSKFLCVSYVWILFAGCGLLLLNSCNRNQKDSNEANINGKDSSSIKVEINNQEDNLSLNLMSDVKDDFNGIGLYIASDSINLENDKYLFIANHLGDAVIKIDSKNIYLKEDTTLSPVRINDSIRERWLGNGIKIEIFMNVINDGIEKMDECETIYMKGILQISSKGQKKRIEVYGMCEV